MKGEIIFSFIVGILLLGIVSAASTNDIIEEKTGINPESLKDPRQLKEEYLQKNWAELISKNKILGPIHNFFLKISSVFNVLFGQPYSLSLTLLVIMILWIFVAKESYKILVEALPFNKLTSFVISICTAIILAQIKILYFISNFLVQLVIAKETWWMRLIVILVAIVLVFMANYGANLLAQMAKKAKQQGRELTLKQKVAETSAFLKGVKEGQKIVKD